MVKRLPSTRMAAPFLNWLVEIIPCSHSSEFLATLQKRRDIIAQISPYPTAARQRNGTIAPWFGMPATELKGILGVPPLGDDLAKSRLGYFAHLEKPRFLHPYRA